MSGGSWEEVRRLASDFQKVQQGSAAQRLSERNCIEIVTSLMKMKLLDVIYTTDGKEYITPQHLIREIRDEIIVHGGRINIVDVAQVLNVDLNHIENAVKDLVRTDPSLQLVLGQLIDLDYVASLADDMNERLQEKGILNVSDLAVVFDLPAEFLLNIVNDNLGKRIHGQRDPNNNRILLTDWLVARHRAILRGSLNASCRPVAIQSLVKEFTLNERLTAIVVEELVQMGEIAGTLSGQGRKDKCTFTPHVYAAAQTEWIDSFFKSNLYVNYESLKKLDIAEPKRYLQNRYQSLPVIFLSSSMVAKSILDRVEDTLEDVSTSGSWVEINGLLPGGIDDNDVMEIMGDMIKAKKIIGLRLLENGFAVSYKMIEESGNVFDTKIEHVAEEEASKQAALILASKGRQKPEAVESRRGPQDDEDESVAILKSNRKAEKQKKQTAKISNKSGKQRRESDGDENSSSTAPEFLTSAAITVELQKTYEDTPYELLNAVALIIQPELVNKYRRVLDQKAKIVIDSTMSDRKSSHKSVQEQVSANVWLMRLFCRGIEQFSSEADKKLLSKHLLRNVGSEILNPVLYFVLDDLGIPYEKKDLTYDNRSKFIWKLPEPLKADFEKCNTASNGDNVDLFDELLSNLVQSESIGMPVKKADKKRESQIIQEHKEQILRMLPNSPDVATALRLACLVIFQMKSGFPLDAPGKMVPQILSFIKKDLSMEHSEFLDSCKEKVQDQNITPSELHDIVSRLVTLAHG